MDLFDTHFHLPGDSSLEHYLDMLDASHNYRMLALGSSLASSQRALEFASSYDRVWCACGVHPHDAEEFDGDTAPFEAMLANPRVKAVGEIGLDFFYDYSPRELQKNCFEKFLQLALKYHLPVSIHCRDKENCTDAYVECYSMLKEFIAEAGENSAVLHCYAGDPDFLEKFLQLGCFIGVTGMVTFPKSNNIRENLKLIPLNKLLLETDSPYLAPVPFRGKTNHPSLVAVTAEYIADFLNMDPENLSSLTTANALSFFRLSGEDK